MTVATKGPWDHATAERFLAGAKLPARVACVGADGFPRVVSLWYRYQGGALQCVTHNHSQLAHMLRRNPRVGFEVAPNEPPYHGVRGQGRVTLSPLGQDGTLRELLLTYLGGLDSGLANWLLSRSDDELLVTITPHRLYSWDYRDRMSDIAVDSATTPHRERPASPPDR
jgi:nitroimidazol reductase NimA-like FMN-containing flavoprotein (pyridoxamine 5'-phosphate oxidase superfamily)